MVAVGIWVPAITQLWQW